MLLLLLDPVAVVVIEVVWTLEDELMMAALLGDFGASFTDVEMSEGPNVVAVIVPAPAASEFDSDVLVVVLILLGVDFGAASPASVESVSVFCAEAPLLFVFSLGIKPGITTAVKVSFFAAGLRALLGDFGAGFAVVLLVLPLVLVALAVVDAAGSFSVVSLGFLARLARFFGLGDSAPGGASVCLAFTTAIRYMQKQILCE